jgi:hypothetical protein
MNPQRGPIPSQPVRRCPCSSSSPMSYMVAMSTRISPRPQGVWSPAVRSRPRNGKGSFHLVAVPEEPITPTRLQRSRVQGARQTPRSPGIATETLLSFGAERSPVTEDRMDRTQQHHETSQTTVTGQLLLFSIDLPRAAIVTRNRRETSHLLSTRRLRHGWRRKRMVAACSPANWTSHRWWLQRPGRNGRPGWQNARMAKRAQMWRLGPQIRQGMTRHDKPDQGEYCRTPNCQRPSRPLQPHSSGNTLETMDKQPAVRRCRDCPSEQSSVQVSRTGRDGRATDSVGHGASLVKVRAGDGAIHCPGLERTWCVAGRRLLSGAVEVGCCPSRRASELQVEP